MTEEILVLAKKVWNYHLLHDALVKSDCILVLGSHDTRVAERGAELYLQGFAPFIVMSGGLGRLTKESFTQPEAFLFAQIAMKHGVPKEAILIEDKSTNTGENVIFSRKLLIANGCHPSSVILVQKPYMERRSFATFKKIWPEPNVCVTSPQISFEDYPTPSLPMEKVINVMVGDLQRIKLYAEKGFQIYQAIPDDVWQAFERLVQLGFDEQLIQL
ncbi:YdcF family protein [Flavisolibacter ginsenosidimutans]|uniref:YdcF family protein n=1 Tax=Flavisolibacter ginsenosidimutans TaxID=661481 RepID=A0A5B8UN20_9BACT|nr:YdcF family protein [Flavisolibacter ginsenosidimutans]QEC57609.1 YdcF family protein [Flavisolibacter ginsenosidimutans]